MFASARRVLMSPIWAAQILSQSKSFVANPLLGSRTLNSWGLHVRRAQLAHRMAARRRTKLAHLVSSEDRAAYERNGFVLKTDFLPSADFATLLAQVKAYRGTVREMTQGDAITRRIALEPSVIAQIPAARALLGNSVWQGLIRYIGSAAIEPVNYIQTILTHVDQSAPDPQLILHADTFHPTVKAWLFLTDVAEDAAPFTYVPGSHRLTPERLAWEQKVSLEAARSTCRMTSEGSFRVSEKELANLGLPPPRHFAVPANTLVVADTCGFHARGPSSGPTFRVEIWAYGRRNPFLPWTGFDLLRRTALDSLRAPLFWRFRDVLDRAKLARSVWKAKPGRTAFDPPGI